MSSSQPNETLYINNLNDKIKKEELCSQLLALFATYGRVIDIRAQKGAKMKGQAFLSFAELTEATSAMRACEGMLFYDKPLVSDPALQSNSAPKTDSRSAHHLCQNQSACRTSERRSRLRAAQPRTRRVAPKRWYFSRFAREEE